MYMMEMTYVNRLYRFRSGRSSLECTLYRKWYYLLARSLRCSRSISRYRCRSRSHKQGGSRHSRCSSNRSRALLTRSWTRTEFHWQYLLCTCGTCTTCTEFSWVLNKSNIPCDSLESNGVRRRRGVGRILWQFLRVVL